MQARPGEFEMSKDVDAPTDAAMLLAALLAGADAAPGGSFDADTAARLAASDPSTFLKTRFTLGF